MMAVRRVGFFLCSFLCITILILFGRPANILAEQKGLVFSTWEGFEADKCASIWLIKRFIDENARIKFFPKGELVKEGIPFDTPDARFRRYHNMSTFESLLKHYELKDPRLIQIGKIIHDVEVNIWEKKAFEQSYVIQDTVNTLIAESKGTDDVIRRTCHYFDLLYNEHKLKNASDTSAQIGNQD